MNKESIVYVVDDDSGICDVVCRLASAINLKSRSFASGREFLDAYSEDFRGCLVLDIWLPDMTGLALYEELLDRNSSLPVIIISGHADIPLTVQAIKKGAVDFLEKPFQNSMLLARMREAVETDRLNRQESNEMEELSQRFNCLTEREREILDLLVDGKQNKQVARILNISPRTVETHRAHIMRKLQADSISSLVHSTLKVRAIAR